MHRKRNDKSKSPCGIGSYLVNILINIKISRPDGAGLQYRLPGRPMGVDGKLNPAWVTERVQGLPGRVNKTLYPNKE